MREDSPKNNKRKNRILAAMFDVRPVTDQGNLDVEKVNQVDIILDLKEIVSKERSLRGKRILKLTKKSFQKPALPESSPDVYQAIEPERGQENIEEEIKTQVESLPTKEEILAELARIDKEEQSLKTKFVQPIKLPQKKILSPVLPPKDSLDDLILSDYFNSLSSVEVPARFVSSPKKDKTFKKREIKSTEKVPKFYSLSLSKGKILTKNQFMPLTSSGNKLVFQEPQIENKAIESLWRVDKKQIKEEKEETKGKKGVGIAAFLIIGLLVSSLIPFLSWFNQGWLAKDKVAASSLAAYQNLLSAGESLKETDFKSAEKSFNLAYGNFFEANEEIKNLGKLTIAILEQLPGGSLVASGSHLVKVGENLALAGENLTAAINLFSSNDLFRLFDKKDGVLQTKTEASESLSDSIALSREKLSQSLAAISLANKEINKVKVEILPSNLQEETLSLKEKLPLVESLVSQALNYSGAFLDILGHNNPRQYLLLFENNSEIRATGGFIGTYGLLTLDKGQIKKLFIDGIFNPDGQLVEKIIPPRPIQKISTAWSMHDANWFHDFPTSAQKVAWFYEKTGGPTVDGVIALTPVLVERLLKLTGPIEMIEYDITLTPENFVELIQYKVEVDYDKELNQPKKILADFAPKLIKVITQLPSDKQKEVLDIVFDSLKEKQILVYFNDNNLEKFVKEQGWAGEILETEKDYLSVVSTNINGYKTDRVVEETIEHQAEIQEDGSVIDTLTITREHQGGGLDYDWWNRVNSNYLRVYLPKGSQLLSAKGHTLETYLPPLDYKKHNFKTDPLVKSIEDKMIIDERTGTHIFEENNKTVFGNWVYISPGETVRVAYKYKLPFKIDLPAPNQKFFGAGTKPSDSYSLLIQKQAGSLGSQFKSVVKFPENWQVSWFYPDNIGPKNGNWELETNLSQDRFFGVTFGL